MCLYFLGGECACSISPPQKKIIIPSNSPGMESQRIRREEIPRIRRAAKRRARVRFREDRPRYHCTWLKSRGGGASSKQDAPTLSRGRLKKWGGDCRRRGEKCSCREPGIREWRGRLLNSSPTPATEPAFLSLRAVFPSPPHAATSIAVFRSPPPALFLSLPQRRKSPASSSLSRKAPSF